MIDRVSRPAGGALAELAILLGVWAAAIAFIHPRGDFPILDDWDFATAAWELARTGHFHFTPFTAVSLRSQALWGALWTRAFHPSFEVLRASTLVLSAGTVVVVHRMLVRAGVQRFGRIAATLALIFHPVFLWSSCTFMTEVPFVFACAVTLYLFVRGFDEDRFGFIVAGCAAAVMAWFVRQTGIALLFAPFLLALWRRRRRDAVAIASTIVLFVLILIFRVEWLAGSPKELAQHFQVWTEGTFRLPEQVAMFDHYATFNAQNCALFFLPLVAPLAFVLARRRSRLDAAIFGVTALILFVRVQSLIAGGLPMPYFVKRYCCDIFAGNLLVDFGLGPQSLEAGDFPFRMPYAIRLLLTYASVIGGALLIWAVLRLTPRTNLALLAAGIALFGSLALFGSGLYVDRYSFDSAWSLVVLLPLMLPWDRRAVRITGAAALLVMAVFSVFSVQEYFAWNRARWTAISGLRARGVPITEINGGSEAFGFYELSKGDRRFRGRHLFGVGERPYTVAFQPVPGQTIVATIPFRGWLGLHKGAIYVLRRGPRVEGRGPSG